MLQHEAKKYPTQPNEPMRSVHTNNFPHILSQLGISLAIADLVGWVEQSETQQQIDKAIMDLWNTVAQDLQEALTFLLL